VVAIKSKILLSISPNYIFHYIPKRLLYIMYTLYTIYIYQCRIASITLLNTDALCAANFEFEAIFPSKKTGRSKARREHVE
jgi:hypothetical protein